jgi:hypothetical protein
MQEALRPRFLAIKAEQIRRDVEALAEWHRALEAAKKEPQRRTKARRS